MSLNYRIFRHSYLGFNSNSILVYGDKDAILIDSSQLLSDSYRLVADLVPMRKRITHIYVSHFHPDHHFGLEVLHYAYPNAQMVALPSVVKDIIATSIDKVEMWDGEWLGRDTPLKTTVPTPLEEPRLEVEGHEILFSDGWNGDSVNNSVAWIPSLKALCATDIAFYGAHVFTIESNVARRVEWRKDIARLMDFDPRIIIPAHCGEAQMQFLEEVRTDPSRACTGCVEWSLRYLDVYEEVYNTAKNGTEMIEAMFRHYGDVKPVDYAVHWQTRFLFPTSSPDWLVPLPAKRGEIFLNPEGGFDGDPPKE